VPRDLFGDVVNPSIRIGSKKWYTVPLSFLVHTVVIGAIVIAAKDDGQITDFGIQYAGIPAGHEFGTLINDIVLVSGRDSGLSEEVRQFLKNLEKPLHLQVFVTPT